MSSASVGMDDGMDVLLNERRGKREREGEGERQRERERHTERVCMFH